MENKSRFWKYILYQAFFLSIKLKKVLRKEETSHLQAYNIQNGCGRIWHLSSLMSKHLLTHLWLCHLWFISLLTPEDKCHIKPQLSSNLAALTHNVHAFVGLEFIFTIVYHAVIVTVTIFQQCLKICISNYFSFQRKKNDFFKPQHVLFNVNMTILFHWVNAFKEAMKKSKTKSHWITCPICSPIYYTILPTVFHLV